MMMIFGLPQKTIEEDIPYDDCGGTDGAQVASIQLTGCETDEICHITMEDILTLKVTWKTYQARITALMSKLEIAFFPGFKRQVPIVPLDACSYLNCPLYSNDDVHYVANFTVPNSREILAGEGRIWWTSYQKSIDDPLLCVNFPIIIMEKN
ncbi:hypothetical protein HHI36_013601 [Cryptolaemus montrouzieri]|uniref:MD-2-related lipid-recognition domain-containing protein n=1 Tax=Cryptolaemus montrouzieri TaxID=559131 RepID=A0ABD2NIC5_9CUCU